MTLSSTNPIRSVLLSVLVFEVIVFWLGFAGMVQVSDVPLGTAAAWTAVASGLALAASAGLRSGWGYWCGWAAQLAGIALGLLTPWMYAMGIIFALIWTMSFVLGKRLEKPVADQPVQDKKA